MVNSTPPQVFLFVVRQEKEMDEDPTVGVAIFPNILSSERVEGQLMSEMTAACTPYDVPVLCTSSPTAV